MPRYSRKRGKQVKKRGISNEQVCMASAVDRQGNIIFEMTNKGRIETADLERLYKGRLDPDALICTDFHKSYITFAKDNVAEHIRIASGKHKNGVYHISHVNSLHNMLKSGLADSMVWQQNICLIICIGSSGYKHFLMKKK